MYKKLSMIGRALMLPIAILPAAGLLLGIGSAFSNPSTIAMFPALGNDVVQIIFQIMKIAGSAVFNNIAFFFAVGVAVGLAKEDKGTAGLSACIAYIIFKATFEGFIDIFQGSDPDIKYDTGVLGGFSIGITVSILHNKFRKIELPTALGFFGGNRFIPIISSVAAIIWGLIFAIIWPPVMVGLAQAGVVIADLGPIGTFLYGFLMRLCGAVGLHHAIYPMFWYTELGGQEMVNGDMIAGAQNIFFAQLADPNHEGLFTYGTRFFAGRFATMMFGLPAAALAMYHCIPKENRAKNKSLYSSGALTSFLTGITEPLEYTFLFVAPWLYVIHAVLDGLSFLVADILCIRIGNAFSAGFIDFTLFGILQGNATTNWILVIPVGLCFALVYYAVFRFCISKFKVPIPGMVDNLEDVAKMVGSRMNSGAAANLSTDLSKTAALIIEALGLPSNIEEVESCATRLRVSVKDSSLVDQDALKATGAIAVIESKGGIQAVYGTKANIYSDEVNELLARPEIVEQLNASKDSNEDKEQVAKQAKILEAEAKDRERQEEKETKKKK